MRGLGWILAVILLVGWIATDLPPLISPAESTNLDLWRRTRDGWERADWLVPEPTPPPLWLHPAALAGLQIVVSVVGFTLFCSRFRNVEASSVGDEAYPEGVPRSGETADVLRAHFGSSCLPGEAAVGNQTGADRQLLPNLRL